MPESNQDYRHKCTDDDPWTREKSFYGDHPDAVLTGEGDEYGCKFQEYHCPYCDRLFRMWPDAV